MWQEGWSPRCRADFLGLGPGQADGDRNRFRLRRVSGVQRPCLRTSFYARDRNRWGGRFKVSVWSVETPHIAVAQHHPLRIKPRLRIKMTWATSSAPGIGRASWTIFQEMQSGRRSLRHCCRQRCPFCRYTPGVWSRAAKPDICDGGDLGVADQKTQAPACLVDDDIATRRANIVGTANDVGFWAMLCIPTMLSKRDQRGDGVRVIAHCAKRKTARGFSDRPPS